MYRSIYSCTCSSFGLISAYSSTHWSFMSISIKSAVWMVNQFHLLPHINLVAPRYCYLNTQKCFSARPNYVERFLERSKTHICIAGNEYLHYITLSKQYTLRIDMKDFENETRYATYSTFEVASESLKYQLTVGGYVGDAGKNKSSFISCHIMLYLFILFIYLKKVAQVCPFLDIVFPSYPVSSSFPTSRNCAVQDRRIHVMWSRNKSTPSDLRNLESLRIILKRVDCCPGLIAKCFNDDGDSAGYITFFVAVCSSYWNWVDICIS